MGKTIISDAVIDRLAALLENHMCGLKVYSSQFVLHIKTEHSDRLMGLIEVAKEEISISAAVWNYNVLIEYPTADDSVKFINHGKDFVCEQLAKQFGGRVSNCRYWILYNEPINNYNHGYKEKLPTAEEVIEYIEKMSQ